MKIVRILKRTPTLSFRLVTNFCIIPIFKIALVAACGELFELSFELPFDEFLPETVPFKFWIQIEGGDLNFYIPEVSTAHETIEALRRNAKILNRDGSVKWNLGPQGNEAANKVGGNKLKKWRNICQTRFVWYFV